MGHSRSSRPEAGSRAVPGAGAEALLVETLDTMRKRVGAQIAAAIRAFNRRDANEERAVRKTDGYIDNLNSQAQLLAQRLDALGQRRLARCAWTMAVNLEHMGDYAVNVAKQHAHRVGTRRPARIHRLESYRRLLAQGLNLAHEAFVRQDMAPAFEACRIEAEIDALYAQDLEHLLDEMMEGGSHARNALTWAFATKNLERMGDMVLNLGEAVLSMLCGERIKLEHLRNIEEALPASSPLRVEGVWGGASGAFIGLVERKGDVFVYKGGNADKIRREYENLERWEELVPGAPPKVLEPPGEGSTVGVQMEHIEAPTLEDVVFRQETPLEPILTRLQEFLGQLWESTLSPGGRRPGFVAQIERRLSELFDLHPSLADLRASSAAVLDAGGRPGLRFPSLAELLSDAAEAERELTTPFDVFLHGDLNLNNLMLDGDRLRVVDVHRSGPGDPAQDLSVLMVSCLRHPLAGGHAGDRARLVYDAMRAWGVAFAEAHGDHQFARRLQLALARSYITSGRVQRDTELARGLYLKGVWYLGAFLGLRRVAEEESR